MLAVNISFYTRFKTGYKNNIVCYVGILISISRAKMSSLETKPTPSGPKNSNSTHSETWRRRSQPEPTSQASVPNTRIVPKKKVVEKKINTFDILDEWDPNRGGMATHIEFIHQSMMDLAAGIEKIDLIVDQVKVVSDQLTIMENHIIRVEKSCERLEGSLASSEKRLDKRFGELETSQDSLHKGQRSIADRLVKLEDRLRKKIEDSTVELSTAFENSAGTTEDDYNYRDDSTSKNISQEYIQTLLSGNTVSINNNLSQMEQRLRKKIEDSKVELSTTFETEAEVCRNIYITEMMNQVSSIKGKGSSVRYMGRKESQGSSISRLSSMLPSFGEEPTSPKKLHIVTVTPTAEE